jgi:hypothetical protein
MGGPDRILWMSANTVRGSIVVFDFACVRMQQADGILRPHIQKMSHGPDRAELGGERPAG